jgi:hypothetical protein
MTRTAGIALRRTRLAGGVWEGILDGVQGDAPVIEASVDGTPIEGVTVTPLAGKPLRFAVSLPIPAWAIRDGVQTILLQSGGSVLAQVMVIAGEPADDDTRAELAQLRAELDLLKRAFQRHVREG